MSETLWVREISEKIRGKMKAVAERNRHKIPYTTENGVFDDLSDKDICWWTNGFFGGMMWQLYHATGDGLYREIALENERKLDANLMLHRGMDHDSGFKWLPTAVADYRITGSKESRNRGLLAADNLAGRFNLAGNFIRAWNDEEGKNAGWAIIDCLMNLPLLYWACEETKDPRYLQIAMAHADTAERYFVREDGSVNHICVFDPTTGEFLHSLGGQGYGEGSSWTRGQAWAIYGFTLSYLHTKKQSYLGAARRVANYFIANLPDSSLVPVDFRQPPECALEDSTAACIAACGLLEIAKLMEGRDALVYRDAALRLLKTIATERSDFSEDKDNIVEKCTAAFHDKKHEFSIIYGDYYFIEGIFKITGEELFLW